MCSSYRAVFVRPGARSLALTCGLGWLSFAGYGLALVLAVEAASGSFAAAGGAVAAFSAGSALLAPVRGRVVDRRGPRVLPWFATVHGCALALVVLGCAAAADAALLLVASAVAGACVPPLIATARAVWPQVTGPELAQTGHAINAALGDAGQVIGPAVIGAVAVLASPVVALALLIPGVIIGSAVLATHASPEHKEGLSLFRFDPAPRESKAGLSLFMFGMWGVLGESAGLRAIVRCELLLGAAFGALDVAAPVVAAAAGTTELAALPLAALAVGSVAMSLWSGTGRLAKPASWRYVVGCVVVAGALLAGLVTTSLPGLTVVLVGAGLGYGLLNVAVFELIEELVPADRAVEAFTWLTTWAGVGLAAGAATAGRLSANGPRHALACVAIPAVLAAATALALRSSVARPVGAPSA